MHRRFVTFAVVAVIAVMLITAGAACALSVVGAAIKPSVAKPGDLLTITAQIDDPQHQVAAVYARSVEFTRMYDVHLKIALNDLGKAGDRQAGDGVWSRRFYIPASPAGPHHFQIVLRDAAGEPLIATGPGAGVSAPRSIYREGQEPLALPGEPVAATLVLEVRNQGGFASPQLLAAAAPWRPEALIRRLQANPRKAGEPFTFVVTGDSAYHPEVFKHFLAIMAGLRPDFSVDCGDIVNGEDDPWEWPFFFAVQMRHVTWPFFVLMGNHDIWPWQTPPGDTVSPQGKLFEQLFGSPDYYFDYGGFRFVAVETGRSVISPERLKWLAAVLDTPLRKIVFTHMPPVSMRRRGQGGSFEVGAQEFADLLAAKKVERVYVGHLHRMGVAEHKGVTYVISGASGQGDDDPLTGSYRHLVFVEAGPGPLRETIYKRDGSHFVLDTRKWIAGEPQ